MILYKRVIFSAFIIFFSCSDKDIEIEYCNMLERDKSFVNWDKSDMEKWNKDKRKRDELINQNFDLLIMKTRQSGFPNDNSKRTPQDFCLERAVTITMIHKSQTVPREFYGDPIINLFDSELKNGNLDPEILIKSCMITARTIEICHDVKPQILKALEIWGLDKNLFDKANFIPCK